MSYDALVKVVLFGGSSDSDHPGPGKSSFLLRFCEDGFSPNYDVTIGVEFGSRVIPHNGKQIKLQIWDTASNERFQSITVSYYRGSHLALLFCDVTREYDAVAANLAEHFDLLRKHNNLPCPIVLVLTKTDTQGVDPRVEAQAREFAESHGIKHIVSTSAKTGEGVMKAFTEALDEAVLVAVAASDGDAAALRNASAEKKKSSGPLGGWGKRVKKI